MFYVVAFLFMCIFLAILKSIDTGFNQVIEGLQSIDERLKRLEERD